MKSFNLRTITTLLLLLLLTTAGGVYAQVYPGGVGAGTVHGWKVEMYTGYSTNPATFGTGSSNTTPRIWGYQGFIDGEPFTGVATEYFCLEYNATLAIQTGANYTFQLYNVDDCAWLYIDGQLVTSLIWNGTLRSSAQAIYLTPGDHAVRVKYSQNWGNKTVGLLAMGGDFGAAYTAVDGRFVRVDNAKLAAWYNADNAGVTPNYSGGADKINSWTNLAPDFYNKGNLYYSGKTASDWSNREPGNSVTNYNKAAYLDGNDWFGAYIGSATGANNGLSYQTADISMYASYIPGIANSGNFTLAYGGSNIASQTFGIWKLPSDEARFRCDIWASGLDIPSLFTTNEPKIMQVGQYLTQGTSGGLVSFGAGNGATPTLGSKPTSLRLRTTLSLELGAYWGSWLSGALIPEVMVYPFTLTETQRKQVDSYLAIKYGTTLAHSYLNSSGQTVFDYTANAGYTTRVLGIARNDNGALYQKQSQSTMVSSGTNNFLKLGVGALAATNTANTGTLVNGVYVVAGDNNGTLTAQQTELPSSFTPGGTPYRINREWKVQVTGTAPANLFLQAGYSGEYLFPLSAAGITLLVDQDGDGNFTTGTVRPYTASAFANRIATFTGVTLNSGEVFTFAWSATAPGGVLNGLKDWYKANMGTSTTTNGAAIATWSDLSPDGNNLIQGTGTYQPKYQSTPAWFNYNPSVYFDNQDAMYAGTQNLGSGATAKIDAFFVANNSNAEFSGLAAAGNGNSSGNVVSFNCYPGVGSNKFVVSKNTGSEDLFSTTPFNGVYPVVALGRYSGPGFGASVNGEALSTNTTSTNVGAGGIRVGEGGLNGEFYQGEMGEVIFYNRNLGADELKKVNSYLAIKYGVTLNTNTPYVASDGTTLWNNATYWNNVFGIGRDDASGLMQLQAKSSLPNDNVSVGLDGVYASNALNPASFSTDKQFLMVGSTGTLTELATNIPASFSTNSCMARRYDRTWKVQNIGNVPAVTVTVGNSSYPVSTWMAAPRLAVNTSGDATFATGTTVLYAPASVTGGVATFNNVSLPDGAVFTFCYTRSSPGGVSDGLSLWMNALELTGTTDGSAITSWNDLSPVGGAGAGSATFYAGSNSVARNYNPVVAFNGSSNNFRLTGGTTASTGYNDFTQGITSFAILNTNYGTQVNWARLLEFAPNNNDNNCFAWHRGANSDINKICENIANSSGIWNTAWIASTASLEPEKGYGLQGMSINAGAEGSGNNAGTFYYNGNSISTTNSANIPFKTSRSYNYIGSSPSNNDRLNGYLPEIILYKKALTATEQQKVNSYLAIKYGLSLPTAYLSSDGTAVFTPAAPFTNDITGIGRDDCSLLSQLQSTSTDGPDMVTVAKKALAASNATNTGRFTIDKSYLVFAHNGGDMGNTSNVPASLTSGCYARLNRVWMATKTNTVDSVQLVVGKNGIKLFNRVQAPRLLVSASPTDFSAATVYVPSKIEQGKAYFSNITFPAGTSYFTIAFVNGTPGGFANTGLLRWYDAANSYADATYSNVTNGGKVYGLWDQGVLPTNAEQNDPAKQPVYDASTLNFNPSLVFDGTKMLSCSDANMTAGAPIDIFAVASASQKMEERAVSNPGLNYRYVFSYGTPNYGQMYALSITRSNVCIDFFDTANTVTLTDGFLPINSPKLIFGGNTSTTAAFVSSNLGTRINGNITCDPKLAGKMYIGSHVWNHPDYYWKGNIMEIVVFGRSLTPNEQVRFASYQAIKYGMTLSTANTNEYLSSKNDAVFNYTTYWNRITGIGVDRCSNLDQRQSRSQETGGMLTMSTDVVNGVLSSNLANNVPVGDDVYAYEVFGDDNKALKWSSFDNPKGNSYVRLYRSWRVKETGPAGSVYLDVPSNASAETYKLPATDAGKKVYLIVANAATGGKFSAASGVTAYPMTYDAVSLKWYTTVDFADGDYFTFGTERFCVSCAGIESATAWFRPDSLTVATMGTWKDQFENYNATRTGSSATLNSGSAAFNYNPSVTLASNTYYTRAGLSENSVVSSTAGAMFGVRNTQVNAFGLTASGYNAAFLSNNGGTGGFANLPYVPGGTFTAGIASIGTINQTATATPSFTSGYNGSLSSFPGGGTITTSNSYMLNIGALYNGASLAYNNGSVAEFGSFNAALTQAEQYRLDSYLAIKYGQTLGHNYYSPEYDGTNALTETLYDISTFGNRVTGIGQDLGGCLKQKQSQSVLNGNMVLLNLYDNIYASNALNPATFYTDNSYLVTGDDNADVTTWASSEMPAIENSMCDVTRITREWKITSYGADFNANVFVFDDTYSATANSAKLPALDKSKYKVVMIVNDTPDFTTNNNMKEVPMTYDATNGTWSGTINVPKGATLYYTFAKRLIKCRRGYEIVNPGSAGWRPNR